MNRDDFVRAIRQRLDWPDFSTETALKGNEKWDSLAQVDVVMLVQEELGETLSTEALQRVANGEELLALVRKQLTA
jgi:acyl carrier protein